MLSSRRSPTRTMAALRHEYCRLLFEVKGKVVWILNVLADVTHHRWRNGNSGPKQRLGGPSFKERDVSAASPICSDFQTFCSDWLHFGHFLCFGGIAASQLSHRIFPIYF